MLRLQIRRKLICPFNLSESDKENDGTLEIVKRAKTVPELSASPLYIEVEGGFLPEVPSPGSCLTKEELAELNLLLWEFKDCFNNGSHPMKATNLVKARLDTGDCQPISLPPRRLSPAMREVVRKLVADMDAKGITEPGMLFIFSYNLSNQ